MKPVKSLRQIADEALSIVPQNAYSFRGTGDAINLCATPLYTAYLQDGETMPLQLIDGKYGAGYVRVSSEHQKQDGWSVADQVDRIIKFFTEKGLAFRIFSDASLSGKLPVDDPDMIQKMLAASAKRYERAYRAVFFSNNGYADEKPEMERWLSMKCGAIKNGTDALKEVYDDLETDQNRKHFSYRPALTELMKATNGGMVHTIAVTDISRLSRSQSLTRELAEDLQYRKVNIVGLIETLDYLCDDDEIGNQITGYILTIIAEHKLREVTVNIIRGIVQMLQSGKPHGVLPHWLTRDEDGNAVLIEERAAVIRRIVQYVLDNPTVGYMRIAEYLNAHPDLFPTIKVGTHKYLRPNWAGDTVRLIISDANLIGVQEAFGRRWKVLPAVIEEWQYERLQEIQSQRKDKTNFGQMSRKPSHLLCGLIRCTCGNVLLYQHGSVQRDRYRCSETTKTRGISENHVSIVAEELEGFISQIMRERPQLMLDQLENSTERVLLQQEVEGLKVRKVDLEQDLLEARRDAEMRATADLTALGRTASKTVISAMAEEDTCVMSIQAQITECENGIQQRRYILNTIMPSEHIAELKERIRQWDALPVNRQNDLLRKLIAEIRVEKRENGDVYHIIPNTPSRIPLWPIHSVKKGRRTGPKYNGIPDVDDWLDSIR